MRTRKSFTPEEIRLLRGTAAIAVMVLIAGIIVALAGCGPSGSSAAPFPSVFTPSAMATSTQVRAAESVARSRVLACKPPGASVSSWEVMLASRPDARKGFYDCEKIPPAGRQAAAACALAAARAALVSAAPKAAREAGFAVALGKCL